MNITLDPDVLDQIVAFSRKAYPLEACGLLVGRSGNASRFIATDNLLASESAYEIDPAVLAATFRSLRQTGEELVAIFHSHPRGPAEPSLMDLERAHYPEAAHVIVSLADLDRPLVRGFRIIDGQAFEIELRAIV